MRGIRTQTKRTKILNHLIKLNADICFLQETHLSNSELYNLKSQQFNQVFSATYNTRKRGVSILVRIPLIHHSTTADSEGRYIIITASIYDKTFTIANIYGPNSVTIHLFLTHFSLHYKNQQIS